MFIGIKSGTHKKLSAEDLVEKLDEWFCNMYDVKDIKEAIKDLVNNIGNNYNLKDHILFFIPKPINELVTSSIVFTDKYNNVILESLLYSKNDIDGVNKLLEKFKDRPIVSVELIGIYNYLNFGPRYLDNNKYMDYEQLFNRK